MSKDKYELFGKKIKLPQSEREVLAEKLTGWITLYEFMTSLPDDDEETILKLIIIESENAARVHIMRRLHSRCITVRRASERQELHLD